MTRSKIINIVLGLTTKRTLLKIQIEQGNNSTDINNQIEDINNSIEVLTNTLVNNLNLD